jgi:hypothetical protein
MLETLEGSLSVTSIFARPVEVSAPRLWNCGSLQLLRVGRAVFPRLFSAGDLLDLDQLASAEFPELRFVGALSVMSTELKSLEFPSLQTASMVRIQANGDLQELSAPWLTSAGPVVLTPNDALAGLRSVTELVSIGGNRIVKSAFHNVSGVEVRGSDVDEPVWLCSLVRGLGLPAPSERTVCLLP